MPERVRAAWPAKVRIGAARQAIGRLAAGLRTAVLAGGALVLILVTMVLCLAGVGVLLVPAALRMVRVVADRERTRLSRSGPEILGPEPVPASARAALRDTAVRPELAWLACHAVLGLLLGLLALGLPLAGVHDVSFPLWWKLVPASSDNSSLGFGPVHNWFGAFAICLLGMVTIGVTVTLLPAMARLQAWPGRRLLPPDHEIDLALRVAELTATRAAALDAHTAELRRIERSLHDGTQNRMVAVNVLVGAAKRALARDPAEAAEILDRAQTAAEYALAELRGVVRSILPPVLTERSLPDALAGLAADCPVTCRIDADLTERCAASVEATVYFAVAEALTNIAKHSGASHATVRLRRHEDRLCAEITDDGSGGADAQGGSGLSGIRRRVEAHDGTFKLSSPVGGPTVLQVGVPCGS
ncbi:MAG: sensor domain-containing protein [Streptosporangiaceae bacterium]